MLVLALDSSSLALSCALCELPSGRALAKALHEPPAKTGDLLPEALLSLCGKAGVTLDDISALAVGIGPGSFTGLRVGLAAAKALAYARKLPLVAASSLRALALGAAPLSAGRAVIATLEARRAELYLRLGDDEVACRAPRAVELVSKYLLTNGPPLLVGPGAAACRTELLAAGAQADWFGPAAPPDAADVVRLCAGELAGARYDQAAVFALQPNYVKPSEAEVALAEGRVGGLPKPGGK